MHVFWTKSLKTQEEKKKFQEYVLNSDGVLDKIIEFIKDKYNTVDNPSSVDYNIESWAYKMADTIGYKRALKEVLELVNVKPDKYSNL